MDPDQIAPEDKRCNNIGRVEDVPYMCQCWVGHDGAHAAEPSPGETVCWPRTTLPPLATPKEREQFYQMTGFIGPYGLKPDAPEERQQRQTSDYENREARRDAVELAVQALAPIIPTFAGDAIGRAIIELATELGTYIHDGA